MYSKHQLSAPISLHTAETHCGCYQEGSQEKVPHQGIWLSSKLVPAIRKTKIKLRRISGTVVFCKEGWQTSDLKAAKNDFIFSLKSYSQNTLLRSTEFGAELLTQAAQPLTWTKLLNTHNYFYKGLKLLLFTTYLVCYSCV